MSAEEVPGPDPLAVLAWLDRQEAEIMAMIEAALEMDLDGAPAFLRRRLDRVLGVRAPEFVDLGGGVTVEVAGDRDPPGAG